jgi:ABC-2 type transport system ATP-binding protein
VIDVSTLTQRYGTYTAVSDLSFSLEAGEVVGFLGPNGAGKTTTLKVLAAFFAPSEGQVVVGGHDVLTEPMKVRQALGYLPEHCPLYGEMIVREFLDFVATVRGLERDGRARAIARVSEQCGLAEVLARPCSDLSKGFRQRVGIAQALIHDPKVLILDEPTSGLDPNQVLEVRGLVRDLGKDRTVLFSSHVLSEVEATCDRVVVIHQGRKVADAGLDALKLRVTGGAVRARFESGPEGLAARVGTLDGVEGVKVLGGAESGVFLVRPAAGVADLEARLFRFASKQDLVLTELAPIRITLEDVFGALTGASRD